jgi:hypothetical protein
LDRQNLFTLFNHFKKNNKKIKYKNFKIIEFLLLSTIAVLVEEKFGS